MNAKKMFVISVLSIFLTGATSFAYAGGHYPAGGSSFKDKVVHTINSMLMNDDEINLTKEQDSKLREIKTAAMKDYIRNTSELELLKIDLKNALYSDAPDRAGISSMIQEKYRIKQMTAMMLMNAYLDAEDVLSVEQKDQLKAIKKNCFMKKR